MADIDSLALDVSLAVDELIRAAGIDAKKTAFPAT